MEKGDEAANGTKATKRPLVINTRSPKPSVKLELGRRVRFVVVVVAVPPEAGTRGKV